MMALTHIAVGGGTALLLTKAIDSVSASQIKWCIAGGLIGSLLPDIDHPKSWLGRRIPFISVPLSAIVGHRGVTHSMIALIVVQAAALVSAINWQSTSGGWLAPFMTGLGVGYASHLLADWLTNSGIPLLWPNPKRFAAPVTIQTGSPVEYLVALGLYALVGLHIVRGLGSA